MKVRVSLCMILFCLSCGSDEDESTNTIHFCYSIDEARASYSTRREYSPSHALGIRLRTRVTRDGEPFILYPKPRIELMTGEVKFQTRGEFSAAYPQDMALEIEREKWIPLMATFNLPDDFDREALGDFRYASGVVYFDSTLGVLPMPFTIRASFGF
jgi:hypothetical protein